MTAKEMYQELKRRLTESGKIYLFLDEVQEIADWERRSILWCLITMLIYM